MPKLTNLARSFRKKPTLAEKLLWEALRRKSLSGYKFRRQEPIDDFIVDFVCKKEKLIIELDGTYYHSLRKEKDEKRTQKLESMGYKVIRYENEYLLNHLEQIVNDIELLLKSSCGAPPP
jgi:very-short-patch-repair endonuclease